MFDLSFLEIVAMVTSGTITLIEFETRNCFLSILLLGPIKLDVMLFYLLYSRHENAALDIITQNIFERKILFDNVFQDLTCSVDRMLIICLNSVFKILQS